MAVLFNLMVRTKNTCRRRNGRFYSFRDFGVYKKIPRRPFFVAYVMEEYAFEKLYSFDNLYKAYLRTRRCKRKKQEVVNFELDLAENLWRLHDELKACTYKPAKYHTFMVYDPKRREIQALAFRDRVVQNSLCENLLRPFFDPRLVYDCAACRIGKGTHFAMDRLSMFMRDYYKKHGNRGWILKVDIKKFFDSIDHEVLKNLLSIFPDERTKKFMNFIIDSYNFSTGKGIPMGNQSSQWFALYYLNGMDRIIKEKYHIKYYSRYMDDLVLVHEDKEVLKSCLVELTTYANEVLKLEFNSKTQIFPIKQGVDYLGWHFYLTDTGKVIRKLRTSNKKRFKRRLKALQKQYSVGEKSLDDITHSLQSYSGHLSHGHTHALKKKVYSNFILKEATAYGHQ